MSCEVAVSVPVLDMEGASAPKAVALTPEEWVLVRYYRGLCDRDQAWMRRMLTALAARTVPE